MMEKEKKPYWRDSFIVFGRMSGWVAVPVVIALFLGKFLDRKFGTAPWLFLGTTAIAFGISLFGIWKESKLYLKKLAEENKSEKKDGGNE